MALQSQAANLDSPPPGTSRHAFACAGSGFGRVVGISPTTKGYLHLAHGLNNFFVLAPNLTIYCKLAGDHPEYRPAIQGLVYCHINHDSTIVITKN